MKLKQSINCKAFKTLHSHYETSLLHYILNTSRQVCFDTLSLQNVAFETKLLRTMYKKRFGQQLQQNSSLRSCQMLFSAMNKSGSIARTITMPGFATKITSKCDSGPAALLRRLLSADTGLVPKPTRMQNKKPLLTQDQDLLFCQNIKQAVTLKKSTLLLRNQELKQQLQRVIPKKTHFRNISAAKAQNLLAQNEPLFRSNTKSQSPATSLIHASSSTQRTMYDNKCEKKTNDVHFSSFKKLAAVGAGTACVGLRQIAQLNKAYLMSADWLLQHLIQQLHGRKSVRPVLNHLLNDASKLMRTPSRSSEGASSSALIGLRVTLTGRLGARKKGMAQQLSRSVGRVPLTTLRQKIDYSQGFISTRHGVIGVKVWVCYA